MSLANGMLCLWVDPISRVAPRRLEPMARDPNARSQREKEVWMVGNSVDEWWVLLGVRQDGLRVFQRARARTVSLGKEGCEWSH